MTISLNKEQVGALRIAITIAKNEIGRGLDSLSIDDKFALKLLGWKHQLYTIEELIEQESNK